MELVKVSLGGLAGVVLAFVIMWWNPFRRVDPFELGPTVSKYARWAVPEQFRDKPMKTGDGSEANNGQPTGPAVAANPPADKPNNNGKGKGPKKPKQDPVELELPSAVADEFNPAPPIDEPKVDVPKLDLPGSDPFGVKALKPPAKPPVALPEETNDDPNPIEVPIKPVERPKPPAEDTLRKAMNEFSSAVGDWSDIEENPTPDRQKQLGQAVHKTLVRLAEELSKPTVSDTDRQEVQILLSGVVENAKVVRPIQSGARFWLTPKNRTSDGIGVLGVVKKSEPAGEWFATEVNLGSTSSGAAISVQVVSKVDLSPALEPDSTAILLGKVVEDPAANLEGFQGNAPRVVVASLYAVKMKKE